MALRTLVQQLLKMQRKAWHRSPVNSERQHQQASHKEQNASKRGSNQSLTFLALCTSAPLHWVKWLWSPPACLSCSPSCLQGSDQKLQLSLQVTCAHCEFYLLQKVDLVEGEHELSFFSLRKKGKKTINFLQENPNNITKKCMFFWP